MENLFSLTIVIVVFLSLLVPVALMADCIASNFVSWLNTVVPNSEE